MATKLITLRLEDDLRKKTDAYAEGHGSTRTGVVVSLLEALHDGRLAVLPSDLSGPLLFPIVPTVGASPLFPALVYLNPRGPDGE